MQIACKIGESTELRLSARHAVFAAKVDGAVETLLAGDLAMNGNVKLWNDWLTEQAGSSLMRLTTIHEGCIRINTETKQMLLYGPAHVKESMQYAIVGQLELQRLYYIILQDCGVFVKAMQGGYGRIVQAIGQEKVPICVTQPRTIKIRGSQKDFDPTLHVFHQDGGDDAYSSSVCSTCLTLTSNASLTPWNYSYCKSCFAD